jgi:enamine deaminase RidA (YjgF/YER057c/UK114 family)
MPSSAATSVDMAVTGFVTEAHGKTWSVDPRVHVSPPRTTPALACSAGQPSICASASKSRDTSRVERRLISTGSPYERALGYSRAVRVGDRVFVAGCAPIMPDDADPAPDSYNQAKRCVERIEQALADAGGSLADVVRTRAYLTPAADFEEFGRAHGEAFREIRPANTTVVVDSLVDPRWLLEIEAEAVLPQA